MTNSIMTTTFTKFYKATGLDSEIRYYAATPEMRVLAREYDKAGDPPQVAGYGVYDTTVSTEYAVAIYDTAENAGAHPPAVPEPTPRNDIFEETKTEARYRPKSKSKRPK